MMTLMTDCDQRDERLGWTGDASLSSDSLSLNYDMSSLFTFYMENIASEEDDQGMQENVVSIEASACARI